MDTGAVRVRIERSGGFAGVTLTAEVSDPEQIARLLVVLPAGEGAGATPPDRFTYRVEIDRGDEAAPPEVRELSEQALPVETRRLLARLLRPGA